MAKIKRESINFKLPKDLVEEVRSRAKELDTTATALVIEGLSIVLGMNQDIGTDANLDVNKSSIVEVESRLHKYVDALLDSHLPIILNRLSLLEKSQSQIRQQLVSNHTGVDISIDDSPKPVGADSVDTPYTQKQLASYLGVSVSTIKSHTKKGKEHFENWSKTQDSHNSFSWSFDGEEPTEYYAIHNPAKLPQIS